MIWEDVLKIEEEDIFDRAGKPNHVVYGEDRNKRGYDAEEQISQNDPVLFNKLNTHFDANPLINDELKELLEEGELGLVDYFGHDTKIDPVKGYHWREAFIKHGFEDGYFDDFSNIVNDYIESLGYETHRIYGGHNIRIASITTSYIDVEGRDVTNRRLGPKNLLKKSELTFYAKRRIADLEHEMSVTDDVALKGIIAKQIKYWQGILAKG